MNLFENAGYLLSLFLYYVFRRRSLSFLLLLLCFTATLSKTLLYLLHEHCSSEQQHPTSHNWNENMTQYVLLYILPNGLWILFPALIIRNLITQILRAMEHNSNDTKTKKQ